MEHPEIAKAVLIVGSQTALATAIGAKQQQIWNWLSGGVAAPAWACAGMESATGGKVLAEKVNTALRWVRVPDADWPHPDGRPCIDVAATAPEPAKAA